jgi:hypothetical protein
MSNSDCCHAMGIRFNESAHCPEADFGIKRRAQQPVSMDGPAISLAPHSSRSQEATRSARIGTMTKIGVSRYTSPFSIEFPADQNLWRLSTANELFKLCTLLAGGLYMARLDRFKDPREGTLGRKTKSLLDKAPEYVKRYIIREYGNARRQSFASCWHANHGQPSEYVWKQFGGNHNGFAIRTTPQRLRKSVESVVACGAGYIGSVVYKKHNKDENKLTNILNVHFVVRDDFKNEQEVRFLIHTFGPHGQQLYGRKGPKGPLVKWRPRRTTPIIHECIGGYRRGTAILLSVDARTLIDEVVVGKRVSRALFKDIEKCVLKIGVPCRRE